MWSLHLHAYKKLVKHCSHARTPCRSVAELTRVDYIDDPCDPVNYNPMSRPLGHTEQRARGMLANKLLPAPGPGNKRLLGV